MVTRSLARAALELFEVDESGLDRLDRAVLDALCRRFSGGPVGVSTLAVAVGEERETVEEVAEPFLVRAGCSPAHPEVGWPRPPAGRTSGWFPRPAPGPSPTPALFEPCRRRGLATGQ